MCPECGKPFDPDDPRTFVLRTPRSKARKVADVFISVFVGLTLLAILLGGGPFGLAVLLPIVIALAVAVLARKRAEWRPWESFLLVCPFYAWVALGFAFSTAGKSLSNLVVEVLLIAFFVPIAILIRVVFVRLHSKKNLLTVSLLVFEVLAVATVFALFPPLRE